MANRNFGIWTSTGTSGLRGYTRMSYKKIASIVCMRSEKTRWSRIMNCTNQLLLRADSVIGRMLFMLLIGMRIVIATAKRSAAGTLSPDLVKVLNWTPNQLVISKLRLRHCRWSWVLHSTWRGKEYEITVRLLGYLHQLIMVRNHDVPELAVFLKRRNSFLAHEIQNNILKLMFNDFLRSMIRDLSHSNSH